MTIAYILTFIIALILLAVLLRKRQDISMRTLLGMGIVLAALVIFCAIAAIKTSRTNAVPLTREQAILLIRGRYPELDGSSEQPLSIKTKQVQNGWYAAFIENGSAVDAILNAKCYFITSGKKISAIGSYVRGPLEFATDIDPQTCVPIQ